MIRNTRSLILALFIYIHASAADKGPNILWLTYEDTSPQFIGCYGNTEVKTPVIDQLAREGVRFTNAFSTATVCAPSRFTLITGCSTEKYGTGNHRSTVPLPDEIKGFPYYMRQKGYYCSNNSKTDYNTANAQRIIKNSWDESSKDAGWHKRNSEQPFFSVFNYMASHQSRTMTNPYAWYEEFVLDELPEDKITPADSIEVPPFFRDTPEMRKHLARVYNSINLTDYQMGLLLDSLREQGLMDETIIFCFADHGEAIPRGKTNPIGLGHRVPFIIWFPEKYKHLSPWQIGQTCDELVCFADLAPTILSIANINIPNYMQGRALLGSQRSESPAMVFGSRNGIDETPGLARTATNGEYLYARIFLPQYPVLRYQKYADVSDIVQLIRTDYASGKLDEAQKELLEQRPIEYLFNLKTDKWEQYNLATEPAYDSIRQLFQNEVISHIYQTNDAHFLPAYDIDSISQIMQISDFCADESGYPLKEIVNAALLIGNGPTVIKDQLSLLGHSNRLVVYYALIGLKAQGGLTNKALNRIELLMNHPYPLVRIEAASIIFTHTQSPKAKKILTDFALHQNAFLALAALQNIQYFDNGLDEFVPTLKQVIDKYDEKAQRKTEIYHIVSTAEVTLCTISGSELLYPNMKPWMNQ